MGRTERLVGAVLRLACAAGSLLGRPGAAPGRLLGTMSSKGFQRTCTRMLPGRQLRQPPALDARAQVCTVQADGWKGVRGARLCMVLVCVQRREGQRLARPGRGLTSVLRILGGSSGLSSESTSKSPNLSALKMVSPVICSLAKGAERRVQMVSPVICSLAKGAKRRGQRAHCRRRPGCRHRGPKGGCREHTAGGCRLMLLRAPTCSLLPHPCEPSRPLPRRGTGGSFWDQGH